VKAIEQCLPVVLFIMRWQLVLAFESVDEIVKHYMYVYKVVLTFEYVDKTLNHDHSDDKY